jgi:hypothetical protein
VVHLMMVMHVVMLTVCLIDVVMAVVVMHVVMLMVYLIDVVMALVTLVELVMPLAMWA